MPLAFERRHLILMTWWFALRRQTSARFSLASKYDSALPPPGGCCLVTASSGCGRQWELEVDAVDWLVGLSFSLLCAFFVKNFAHSSKTVPWRCWRGRCQPDPADVHRWDGWRWGLRMVWDVSRHPGGGDCAELLRACGCVPSPMLFSVRSSLCRCCSFVIPTSLPVYT